MRIMLSQTVRHYRENAESDDKAQESTEADNETSQENADDDLPEGFEIEDHYETVGKNQDRNWKQICYSNRKRSGRY